MAASAKFIKSATCATCSKKFISLVETKRMVVYNLTKGMDSLNGIREKQCNDSSTIDSRLV